MDLQLNLSVDDVFIDDLFDRVWDIARTEGSRTSKWADLFKIESQTVFIVVPRKGKTRPVSRLDVFTAVINIIFGDDVRGLRFWKLFRNQDLDVLSDVMVDDIIRSVVEGRIAEAD